MLDLICMANEGSHRVHGHLLFYRLEVRFPKDCSVFFQSAGHHLQRFVDDASTDHGHRDHSFRRGQNEAANGHRDGAVASDLPCEAGWDATVTSHDVVAGSHRCPVTAIDGVADCSHRDAIINAIVVVVGFFDCFD